MINFFGTNIFIIAFAILIIYTKRMPHLHVLSPVSVLQMYNNIKKTVLRGIELLRL